MKKLFFHPALLAFLMFACKSEARTTTRTFTGDRVYVRGDGRVEIVTPDAEGRPEMVLVEEGPRGFRMDPVVKVIPDLPDGRQPHVVRRLTIGGGCAEPARTEVDVHVQRRRPIIVRERVIGADPGLVYYE
jgi:hypothetical protein